MPVQDMRILDRELILSIAADCDRPTGDPVLDGLYEGYNTNSPREDRPVYYRFLYQLSKRVPGLSMVELGSYKGAASLHFLRGGGQRSVGIDKNPREDLSLFNGVRYFTRKADSVSKEANLEGTQHPPDVLLIDTDHTYERTKAEFEAWRNMVKPGGLVLFDDIAALEFGCARFWDELPGEKLTLPELHPVGWGFGVYFA